MYPLIEYFAVLPRYSVEPLISRPPLLLPWPRGLLLNPLTAAAIYSVTWVLRYYCILWRFMGPRMYSSSIAPGILIVPTFPGTEYCHRAGSRRVMPAGFKLLLKVAARALRRPGGVWTGHVDRHDCLASVHVPVWGRPRMRFRRFWVDAQVKRDGAQIRSAQAVGGGRPPLRPASEEKDHIGTADAESAASAST